MTFQEIILNLQKFWSDQGCIVQNPYDIEKGAGTMNPATFLHAIGPEPWAVCYVEPWQERRHLLVKANIEKRGRKPNRVEPRVYSSL